MKERIQNLLLEMNKGLYEKETELALSLLAALAGESIILLGLVETFSLEVYDNSLKNLKT